MKDSRCSFLIVLIVTSVFNIFHLQLALGSVSHDQISEKFGVTEYSVIDVALPAPGLLPDNLEINVNVNGVVKILNLTRQSVHGKNYELLVQRESGEFEELPEGEVITYRGTVYGEPDTVAAASLLSSGLYAYICGGNHGWFIKPIKMIDPLSERQKHLVFDESGIIPNGLTDEPGHDMPDMVDGMPVAYFSGSPGSGSPSSFTRSFNPSPVSFATYGCDVMQAEIAIDAAYKYYEWAGYDTGAVTALIDTTVNTMNALYIRDALIEYVLGRVVIRADSVSCPYFSISDSAGSGEWLTAVRAEWNTHQPGSNHDVAGVATPRVGGGIAWVSVVCSTWRYSANGISGDGTFHHVMRHELGHNWSCWDYHEGCPEGKTIMCGNDLTLSRFSGKEVLAIINHRDSRTCLDNIGPYTSDIPPYAALDQEFTSVGSSAVTIDVLGNDHDANCSVITIDSFDTVSAMGGTISLSPGTGPGGRDELTYTPPGKVCDFCSEDSFTYTIIDDTSLTATGNVQVFLDILNTLKGYWKLDESSGLIARDSGIFGFNGTLEGGVDFDPPFYFGKFGNALIFDGVDDHVELPPMYLNSNTLTLTAWVQRKGVPASYSGIIFNRTDGGAGLNFGNSSELRYHWNDSYWDWDSGLTVPDDHWTFVALVIAPAHATIYMNDGTGFTSATNPGTHDPESFAANTYIAWDSNFSDRHFHGAIDDVRIYNYSLSPSDLDLVYKGGIAGSPNPFDNATGVTNRVLSWAEGATAVMNQVYMGTSFSDVDSATSASPEYKGDLTDNHYLMDYLVPLRNYFWRIDTVTSTDTLKGNVWNFTAADSFPPVDNLILTHLTMDTGDISGSVIHDISGPPLFDGTIYGAATGSPGQIAESFSFDGVDDYISIPPMNLNTNTMTISAWVKRNGPQNSFAGIVICVSATTKSGINFLWATNKLGYHWNGKYWSWDSGLFIPDDEWCHVALVVKPDEAVLYLNGNSVVNRAVHDAEEFDEITRIANYDGWTDRFFKGRIDDVAIWNRALNPCEIRTIFYSGLQNKTFTSGANVDIDAGWMVIVLTLVLSGVICFSRRLF